MANSKKKNPFVAYLSKVNSIDINKLISSLKTIKLKDFKNIDLRSFASKLKKSSILKPSIGLLGASFLFGIFLFPSLESFISQLNKSRQYQKEANSLELRKSEYIGLKRKIEKLQEAISIVDGSILKKDDLIFVSNLLNQAAIKSNVQIVSFTPIDVAKSSKLCKEDNQAKINQRNMRKLRRSNQRNKRRNSNKKGPFESNLYEINLKSDYLNIIEFIKTIQYYDVTINPHCLEITARPNTRKIAPNSSNSSELDLSSTIITPLSQSGQPLKSPGRTDELNEFGPGGLVIARLILRIPSHIR